MKERDFVILEDSIVDVDKKGKIIPRISREQYLAGVSAFDPDEAPGFAKAEKVDRPIYVDTSGMTVEELLASLELDQKPEA